MQVQRRSFGRQTAQPSPLTHVRLMADVTARTTRRGREERVQEDHLVLVRTGFGHPAAADGR